MAAHEQPDSSTSEDIALSLQDLPSAFRLQRPEVADELDALEAIYGTGKFGLHALQTTPWHPKQSLRCLLKTTLPNDENVALSLLVSLPPGYPESTAPQLQLAGKYIDEFAIESDIFGQVTRTFMHEDIWQPGQVALFDGIERAREACERFVQTKRDENLARKTAAGHEISDNAPSTALKSSDNLDFAQSPPIQQDLHTRLPEGYTIVSSDPIVDRKSVFVGHACAIKDPQDVAQVVRWLLQDRKIAKAAHPAMLAYRCNGPNGAVYQDNDDDGESAAGSRLAHLLQILDINNVLVIVTRWYGGIHLGSDRFKHISQAARDALELGGFIRGRQKK